MLFTARDEDGDLYDAAHLAQLIAALEPPPVEFLAKNPTRKADFWDEQGMYSINLRRRKKPNTEAVQTALLTNSLKSQVTG